MDRKVIIASFSAHLLMSQIGFFLPLYLLGAGFTGVQMGILISMGTITAIFFTFPTGMFNDHVQGRKVLAFGFLLASIYYLALNYSKSFYILLLFFFIGGIGKNTITMSLEALILKMFQKETDYGLFRFASSIATAIGYLTGGILILFMDFSFVFKMTAGALLVLSLYSFTFPKTATVHTGLKSYGKDFFKKDVLLLAAILFLNSIHWGAEATSYTPFLREYFGLNTLLMGLYMSIPVVWLAVIAYYTGERIEKHLSAKKGLYAGLLLSGLGLIGMTVPSLWLSFLWRIVHELGDGIILLIVLVDISRLFKKSRIGGDAGMMQTIMILGCFFGSLFFGPLGASYGFHYPLIISGIITLIGLAIAVSFRAHLHD